MLSQHFVLAKSPVSCAVSVPDAAARPCRCAPLRVPCSPKVHGRRCAGLTAHAPTAFAGAAPSCREDLGAHRQQGRASKGSTGRGQACSRRPEPMVRPSITSLGTDASCAVLCLVFIRLCYQPLALDSRRRALLPLLTPINAIRSTLACWHMCPVSPADSKRLDQVGESSGSGVSPPRSAPSLTSGARALLLCLTSDTESYTSPLRMRAWSTLAKPLRPPSCRCPHTPCGTHSVGFWLPRFWQVQALKPFLSSIVQ